MNLADYHIHTYLCGHASGNIDDYINSAISKGFQEIGFADHTPLAPDLCEGFTMKPEEIEFYINEIEKRKDKYFNKIKVKLGFEVNFPVQSSFKKHYFNDSRIDFLTGSCHWINDWPFDHPDFIEEYQKKDINKIYTDYYSIIESLVESRLFDIVGHFDLIKKFDYRPDKDFHFIIEKILKKMASSGVTVEINTSGLLVPVSEIYPSDSIIEMLYNNNIPVTLSSDSHSPEQVGYMFSEAIEKIKKIGYRKISGFTKRTRYDINI